MTWLSRLSPLLRELRVQYPPGSPDAHGLRSFIQQNYEFMRRNNPHTAILLRTGQAARTRLVLVKAEGGQELEIACTGLSEEQVAAALQDSLAKLERSGSASRIAAS